MGILYFFVYCVHIFYLFRQVCTSDHYLCVLWLVIASHFLSLSFPVLPCFPRSISMVVCFGTGSLMLPCLRGRGPIGRTGFVIRPARTAHVATQQCHHNKTRLRSQTSEDSPRCYSPQCHPNKTRLRSQTSEDSPRCYSAQW
jgi:hypothetical protein